MSYYQRFYDALEETVLAQVKPRMVFTLSGGLDTRLVAAVLAKNNCKIPSVGYGDRMERVVSRRVAAALGFEHYEIPQRFAKPWQSQMLYDKGFRYIMVAGTFFDEICGDWGGYRAKYQSDFEKAVHRCMNVAILNFNSHASSDLLTPVAPMLDPKLQMALAQVPWRKRRGKNVQRYLLKTKFPQLWHILYYDSLLPPAMPFTIHSISDIVIHRNNEFFADPKGFMVKLLC